MMLSCIAAFSDLQNHTNSGQLHILFRNVMVRNTYFLKLVKQSIFEEILISQEFIAPIFSKIQILGDLRCFVEFSFGRKIYRKKSE